MIPIGPNGERLGFDDFHEVGDDDLRVVWVEEEERCGLLERNVNGNQLIGDIPSELI